MITWKISHYKKTYPWATLTIRGDSGFAVPGLYELCEEHETTYAIRLKANKKLTTKAQELESQLRERTTIHSAAPYVFYKEFSYKAASWNRSRRVVVKLEKPA
ncbi:transposase, partial [Salipaludibacillus sp. CF4.18]|uniref:transposase n=1 Tax=Salipaludibacillus sp. CF4.18 TaxID=3373081 RepID=UPI003EE43C05